MALGKNIKRLREERKWTLERLSERSGADIGTLGALEKRDSKRSAFAQQIADALGVPLRSLLADEMPGPEDLAKHDALIPAIASTPAPGYIRLEHLSPRPSMGKGAIISESVQIVQYLDVLEQWVRQNVGSTNPARIKVLTGNGNSMAPTIHDKDLVFVDVECHTIESAGIYVLDVAGRFILKKAMILSDGTLIIRSDNVTEYPDEERHDLRRASETIIVCGKVLAWWTLRKG